MQNRNLSLLIIFFIISFSLFSDAFAENRVVNLHVCYKRVNFTCKPVRAITVNGQIPGPILHFKQGDHVTLNVYNDLEEETSIHWHGLLVPWKMDGVSMATQKPIPPGCMFSYQFTLKQSGTYWYHSHKGLQEQRALYGAFVIDPPQERYKYNKDFVVVLSDWSNTHPDQIFANLKKEGDFYDPLFPLQPSLARFFYDYHKACTSAERKEVVDAYKMMQQSRMSVYDLSDVAYDAFLMNGHDPSCPWIAKVNVGDTVRLRFIGASATAIFRVKIVGASMQMIHVQGNDVQPFNIDSFIIAPGETYDVLVHVQKHCPYVIYAESIDKVGAAYGALITNECQPINWCVKPFPDPAPIMMMMGGVGGMSGMGGMPSMSGMNKMKMSSGMKGMGKMKMDSDMSAMSGMHPMKEDPSSTHKMSMKMNSSSNAMMMNDRCTTNLGQAVQMQYQKLKSPYKTNDPNKPFHEIRIKLSGYMNQFIWFLNGVPEYLAKPILIEPGQRYRLVFVNDSMMQHPMHLHGHWLILRNGHGEYDPLMHTIDVPPNATVTVDFDANADGGQWYFHCHNLYHMKAGMANIVRYNPPLEPCCLPACKNLYAYQSTPCGYAYLPGHKTKEGFFKTILDVNGDFADEVYQLTLYTLIGPDYNKLQFYTEEAEIDNGTVDTADIDVFYWRLLSQFWAIKGGANYVYRPAKRPYLQPGFGVEGLTPYFIQINLRSYFHSGSVKFDLQLNRDIQLDHNLFLGLGVRPFFATKTVEEDEVGSGIEEVEWTVRPFVTVSPNVLFYIEYERTDYYGARKSLREKEGDSTFANDYFLGVSFLF